MTNPVVSVQFDSKLLETWNQAMKDGHFRYNLESLNTRVIPGAHNFVTQVR